MSGLSTHVLDLARGVPAAGVPVRLTRGETLLFEGRTDADGRCRPIAADALEAGAYRLRFEVAGYFRDAGVALADPPFLDGIAIDFAVADPARHHHVPLLVSPFGYSTYRGS